MDSMSQNVMNIIAAFTAAETSAQYNQAKRQAEKLGTIEQLALIDTMIDAHNRISGRVR